MFDPSRDPLGLDLQRRAQRYKERDKQLAGENWNSIASQNPNIGSFGPLRNLSGQLNAVSGPLPNPEWDGWFQALREQGVDNLADDSVGAKRGLWSAQPPPLPAGMTEDAVDQSAIGYAQGGQVPEAFQGTRPEAQDYMLQRIKTAIAALKQQQARY